jgi:large subunit ribosomal protein L3
MNRLLLSSTSSILRRGVSPASTSAYPSLSSLHHYSTTTPNPKIHSNNDKLTQAEMEAEIQTAIQNAKLTEQAKYNPSWKKGQRKKPLRFAHTIEEFDNEHNPVQWIPRLNRRCGAMGIKIGMMPIWDEWGERHACTVLYLDSNVVLRKFTQEEDGYVGVQVGAGQRKAKNVSKPVLGHYKKHGIDIDTVDENGTMIHPPYVVREFRLTHEEYCLEQGDVIHARHFTPGQNVDVSAISKGKGFQGAMKRWNFAGLPATHGTSRSHRSLGSTGQCQDPGRVFKGKKMAGRMGAERVTTQNLRIVKIDRGRNLIYIKGPVPGQKGNFVEIRDAVKKPLFGTEKVEGEAKFPPLPTFEYEEGVDGCGEGGFEIMMPQQKEDPFDPPMNEAA